MRLFILVWLGAISVFAADPKIVSDQSVEERDYNVIDFQRRYKMRLWLLQ